MAKNEAETISTDERKWRAEGDARTLAEADVIKNDKKRVKAAIGAAKRLKKEKEDEAKGMRKVATLKFKDM